MKLPDIDYGGAVPGTAQTAALPYNAAAGAGQAIQEGLAAYHQELVKSEQIGAAIRVKKDLNTVSQAITSRKWVTGQELRATLGDQISPAAEEAIRKYGEEAIPMWAVSGEISARGAQKAVEAAQEGVSGPGWKTHFRENIAPMVLDHQQGMAAAQLHALNTYLNTNQKQQVKDLVQSGAFGEALKILPSLKGILPEEREALVGYIAEEAELDPIRRAAQSGDPRLINEQLARLRGALPAEKDGGLGIANIPPEKKVAWTSHLEAQLRAIDAEAQHRLDRWHSNNANSGWGRLAILSTQARLENRLPTVQETFSVLPDVATVKGDAYKALVDYAEKLADGKPPKTDLATYQELHMFAAANPEAFAEDRIQRIKRPDPRSRNPQIEWEEVPLLAFVNDLEEGDFKGLVHIQTAIKTGGREAAHYQDFLGTKGYLDSRLTGVYHYDLANLSGSQRIDVGRYYIMVNSALSKAQRDKNGKLTTSERDAVIDRTLQAQVGVDVGFISDTPEAKTTGDPKVLSAIYSLSTGPGSGGRKPNAQKLDIMAKDFSFYEKGILEAWQARTKAPLSVETAVYIWAHLKERWWSEIDAELEKDPKLDMKVVRKNPNVNQAVNGRRAAMAVDRYFRAGGK